jgi:ABC-type bacteriocin/lantibiotic exporter with double-glycine peptidase domain
MMSSNVDTLSNFGSSINTYLNNGLPSDTDSVVLSPDREFKSSLLPKGKLAHSAIEIEEAFKEIKLNLKNINIKIPKGKCIGLIGKVGAGKSSLLSCLTGELYTMYNTRVNICGDMSYVSQKAWISSKNIRDNIVFEREFDEQRYNDSIKYSCMEEDLKILENGDLTQLGDKGVNLSGG